MAVKPYRPSNGTEGEYFMAAWCARCRRDEAHRKNPDAHGGCRIIVAAHAYDIGDAYYPAEWVQDDNGENARCTAFEELHPLTAADRAYLAWRARRDAANATTNQQEPAGHGQE